MHDQFPGTFQSALVVPSQVPVAVIVIVTAFDVAGLPVVQAALEVSTQLTASPFTSVDVTYVELFVPVFEPFSCHW